MTSQTSDKPVDRDPETGWREARRLRGKRVVRTCVPAVVDGSPTRTAQLGPDWNIVRGED
ncbi:hypothetical protein ABT301_24890 [Streptomyces sp. NPDC000987]|uniref:hypothetical protein n=1 Tax=unclassified Streptomyces TaxID=2593676 RepID=UPI002D773F9D|nr:hypothetical protein [Streptomyces sp. H51]